MNFLEQINVLAANGEEEKAVKVFTDAYRINKTGAFQFELLDENIDVSAALGLLENEATQGAKGVLFRNCASAHNTIRNLLDFFPFKDVLCTKVVAQGDSWFAFPFVKPTDVCQSLAGSIPVFTLACPGDDVSDMSGGQKLKNLTSALKSTKAEIVILSGGGNELVGEEFPSVLNVPKTSKSAIDFIDKEKLQKKLNAVIDGFETILKTLINTKPDVYVFTHGYDYPFPQDKPKTFLGNVLKDMNIPQQYWNGICAHIIDQFDGALADLSRRYPQNFFRVDLRGVAQENPNNWHDEIHLDSETAALAANLFLVQFERILGNAFIRLSD